MQPPDEKCNSKGYGGITVPIEHPRCPKCGSILLFNGNLVWCPFVGSSEEKACDFGIYRNITRNEATVLWWKSLDVGQRLTDDQIAMFLGWSPTEEVKPESNGSITVEIIEATEHRPERVALGFYNVDHHIDIEQAIAMANDILEKTGELTSARQRLASQREEAGAWKERAECMVELVNAALAVADSIKLWEGGKTATASPPLCADLIELAAIYASKAAEEIRSSQPE